MYARKVLAEKRGAVVIMIAIAAVVLLGFAGLVIDIGYGLVARNELQNISDAAALAGTRVLGKIYEGMPPGMQANYTLTAADKAAILTKVAAVAQDHTAAGSAITIDTTDIQIGDWDPSTHSLTVTDTGVDAVAVIARRDGSANGPISTFFAKVLGQTTFSVSTRATAALSGLGQVDPGAVELPIGISKYRFTTDYCDKPIKFHPSNDPESCGGWTSFYEQPASTSTLKGIVQGMTAGTFTSPSYTVGGAPMQFVGGSVATLLKDIKDLYNEKMDGDGVNDGEYYCEAGHCGWKTTVVVYDSNDCSNPNQALSIIGFAEVIVTDVLAPPDGQLVQAYVVCEKYEQGQGGGMDAGLIGTIPKLVQ